MKCFEYFLRASRDVVVMDDFHKLMGKYVYQDSRFYPSSDLYYKNKMIENVTVQRVCMSMQNEDVIFINSAALDVE